MIGQSFSDVCPLLLTTSDGYSQHVRVGTDLQLTTSNLRPTVSYVTSVNPKQVLNAISDLPTRSQDSPTCVILVEPYYQPLGTMTLASLVM